MFSIWAKDLLSGEETCIYDQSSMEDLAYISSASVKLEANTAGTLSLKSVPGHSLTIGPGNQTLLDVRYEQEFGSIGTFRVWTGRVISFNHDIDGSVTYDCEGVLAFLNDSIQPPHEYHNYTVRDFLEALMSEHNSQVQSDFRVAVGFVGDFDDNSLYRYTNYETTWECIKDKLIDRLGGNIRMEYHPEAETYKFTLIYDKDYAEPTNSNPGAEYGVNVKSYSLDRSNLDIPTVVVPLGERLEESPIPALEAYLTVAEVNHGSIFVKATDLVPPPATAETFYGKVAKVIHWDEVTEASNLLTKAKKYLSNFNYDMTDNYELSVEAVDMHYLDPDNYPIPVLNCYYKHRIIIEQENIDENLPLKELTLNLVESSESTMTFANENTNAKKASDYIDGK